MAEPTVVLVHGAWHGAWCWDAQRAALDALGIVSLAVDLPGHGASPAPLGDLHGDADQLAGVLRGLGTDAVLVGHSYGGAVITDAAAQVASVRHLVYLAAFCPDVGETVGGLAATATEPSALSGALRVGDDGNATLDPDAAVPALYGDCSPDDIARALANVGPQPLASFGQSVRAAAWRTVPSTYVVCEQDRAVPPGLQRSMAARCATVTSLDASHSPFLSMPGAVAAILAQLVRP